MYYYPLFQNPEPDFLWGKTEAEFQGEKEACCKTRIKTIDFLTYLEKKYNFYLQTESGELFIFQSREPQDLILLQ